MVTMLQLFNDIPPGPFSQAVDGGPLTQFLSPPISTECQKWSILAHIFFYSMYFFDILPINLSVCIYAEWCDKNPHSFTMGNILPFSTQFLPNMVMQQKMHTEFSAIRLIHFRWCSKMVIIEIYFILFFITWNYLKILVDYNWNLILRKNCHISK